jgi:hypothetical protein
MARRTAGRRAVKIPVRRIVHGTTCALLGVALLLLVAWGVLALYYTALPFPGARIVGPVLFGAGSIAAILFLRRRLRGILLFAAAFSLTVLWHDLTTPRNDRDWIVEFERLSEVEFRGDLVRLRNIRDFAWHTPLDATPHWYNATFDLRDVRTVDLAVCLWTAGSLGHIVISFGFADGRHLCVSVEARRERGEEYGPLPGMFRQYELVYVFAYERDVFRLRAVLRDESVYLYRIRTTPERARRVLVDYLERANDLAVRPEFYHSLLNNCTTNVLRHARAVRPDLPYSINLLLNGFSDRYALEHGLLVADLLFEELRAESRINEAARAAEPSKDLSLAIRAGRPGMDPPR